MVGGGGGNPGLTPNFSNLKKKKAVTEYLFEYRAAKLCMTVYSIVFCNVKFNGFVVPYIAF